VGVIARSSSRRSVLDPRTRCHLIARGWLSGQPGSQSLERLRREIDPDNATHCWISGEPDKDRALAAAEIQNSRCSPAAKDGKHCLDPLA
jgi:hypothetical protein